MKAASFPCRRPPPATLNPTVRWAIAAAVLATAGLSVWIAYDQYGNQTGHAIVQAVNGTLYEILPTGIRCWPPARSSPTASRSAPPKIPARCCKLKDGSVVEMRERSGFSTTQTASDLTIRLGPRQHHRAGRQAQLRPPVCSHRRLPRRRHRHRLQRDQRREGIARQSVIEGEVHVTQDTARRRSSTPATRPSPAPTSNPSQ